MCMVQDMFPGLNLYCTDRAQHMITAGQDVDDLCRDLSDLSDPSVRRMKCLMACRERRKGRRETRIRREIVSYGIASFRIMLYYCLMACRVRQRGRRTRGRDSARDIVSCCVSSFVFGFSCLFFKSQEAATKQVQSAASKAFIIVTIFFLISRTLRCRRLSHCYMVGQCKRERKPVIVLVPHLAFPCGAAPLIRRNIHSRRSVYGIHRRRSSVLRNSCTRVRDISDRSDRSDR